MSLDRYDSDVPPKIAPWLAEALRREQATKDWSVVELAQRANIDRSHLGEILGAKRSPNVETLERLCEALEVSLSAIFLEAERRRDARR